VLREIESQSGAWVAIDQATKELGFSTVRISGDPLECQAAKQLIEVKIKEATARQGDGLGFRP
ncbi:Khsrp, partial [Symbiodinium sp. KB8]